MMRFQTYKLLLLSFFIFTNLNASDILSNRQNNILELSNKKANEDASKLFKDIISPINYSYIYNKDEKFGISKKSIISINQPIFKSGGIYYAIKYASNLKQSSKISLSIQKKNLIFQTLNIVYNIKKIDLQIKKQNLLLQNASIDLKNKKESVFNGLLDISFLNNALISLNNIELSLIDLTSNKNNLILNLAILSDLSYEEIILPKLELLSKDEFLKNNLNIKKDNLTLKSKNYLKGISDAKYLPGISVNYKKTISHDNLNDNYNYGFSVNIPIYLSSFNAMKSSRIDYLNQLEQNKINRQNETLFINTQILNINNIQNKIKLTKLNIKTYEDLLVQTEQLSDVGLKTLDETIVLKNSLQSEKLNINLYNIDKQIQLLEIYKRVTNDKI